MMTRREALQPFLLGSLRAALSPTWLRAANGKAVGAENEVGGRSTRAPYRVVHGWPILPEGYVLGEVSGVGVDSHGHVFVFHRADHSLKEINDPITVPTVMCFDGKTGKLLTSWGADMFVAPHGLRVDRNDNVWLTDTSLHQAFKYTHDGKPLMAVGTARTPGCDGKHFDQPTDVAAADDGSFYVGDGYGNSRIAKFSAEGQFLFEWGRAGSKPGEFNLPHSIVIGTDGRIYVADRGNGRIQVFTGDGKFTSQWKSAALGRPWGLTISPQGELYVVDGGDVQPRLPGRASIVRLDSGGNILEKWSSFGNSEGQLYWGHDIAVDTAGDVYVGDVYFGMRVQKFSRSERDCLCLHQ